MFIIGSFVLFLVRRLLFSLCFLFRGFFLWHFLLLIFIHFIYAAIRFDYLLLDDLDVFLLVIIFLYFFGFFSRLDWNLCHNLGRFIFLACQDFVHFWILLLHFFVLFIGFEHIILVFDLFKFLTKLTSSLIKITILFNNFSLLFGLLYVENFFK